MVAAVWSPLTYSCVTSIRRSHATHDKQSICKVRSGSEGRRSGRAGGTKVSSHSGSVGVTVEGQAHRRADDTLEEQAQRRADDIVEG